jgi:uncharacterized protein (DUF934 family)
VRRREAPPHTIWVLICPDTDGYSYKSRKDGLYIVAIAFPAFENVIKKYEEQV